MHPVELSSSVFRRMVNSILVTVMMLAQSTTVSGLDNFALDDTNYQSPWRNIFEAVLKGSVDRSPFFHCSRCECQRKESQWLDVISFSGCMQFQC